MLDGAPIAVIATFKSGNKKTGPMVQTWVIRTDLNPVLAINTGADESVCGNCPLRGKIKFRFRSAGNHLSISGGMASVNVDRGCYVRPDQAPLAVYWAFLRGKYPIYNPADHDRYFVGRKVRLGSYGEILAAPLPAIVPILRVVRGWTGYSHQWDKPEFQAWVSILHASVHTHDEYDRARTMGWKCFITAEALPTGCSWCNSPKLTCEQCGACKGAKGRSKAIKPHGSPATLYSIRRTMRQAVAV
jgi:hypothetical protein